MNRAEFLAALETELQDVTPEERDEALKFYAEYLDEAGPESEASVLAELGTPHKVACIIRANCGYDVTGGASSKKTAPAQQPENVKPKPELTFEGPAYAPPRAPEPPVAETQGWAEEQRTAEKASGAQGGPAPGGYNYSYTQQGSGPRYTNAGPAQRPDGSNRTLWIILIVVTFPIWIGLVGGLIGLVGGLVGVIFSVLLAGFATVIAGVAAFAVSIGLFATSTGSALLMMGLSLVCVAIGCLFSAGTVWLCQKVLPAVFRGIGSFFNAIGRKVRR